MDIFSDMNDYVMPSTAYAEPYDEVGLSLDEGHQNEVSYGQVATVDYGQQPSYGNTHHQQTYYEHKEGDVQIVV